MTMKIPLRLIPAAIATEIAFLSELVSVAMAMACSSEFAFHPDLLSASSEATTCSSWLSASLVLEERTSTEATSICLSIAATLGSFFDMRL